MASVTSSAHSVRERLDRLFKQRIVIFDGSIGVLLQKQGLTEEDWRGERFRDHPKLLKNNVDILNLSRPDVVSRIHREYLEAGADLITTNPSPAPPVSRPTTDSRTSRTRSTSPVRDSRERRLTITRTGSSPGRLGPPTSPFHSRRKSRTPHIAT